MDIGWLVAAVAFFVVSNTLVAIFARLQKEE